MVTVSRRGAPDVVTSPDHGPEAELLRADALRWARGGQRARALDAAVTLLLKGRTLGAPLEALLNIDRTASLVDASAWVSLGQREQGLAALAGVLLGGSASTSRRAMTVVLRALCRSGGRS